MTATATLGTRPVARPALIGVALGVVVLAMAIVEYGPAWYFPIDGRNLFTLVRPFGSQFRVLLWALIGLSVCVMAVRGRLGPAAKAFTPFAPFFAVAIISSIIGDQPTTSAWYMAQWLAMVLAAVTIGMHLPPRLLRIVALAAFATVIVGSLLLFVASPRAGVMLVGGKALLRGLFAGKNSAGWFAALCCVWAITYRNGRLTAAVLAVVALALLMMARAQSATAIVMLAGGMGYYVLLSALKRAAFTPGLRMLVAGLAIAATAIGFEAILPMVLKLVGRDPTLTGRTELWGLYWRFMQHSIVLGRGPGAFAAGSQLNFSIAPYVQNDFVVSVHNLYLNMFGETGLLGLSLYVLAFLYIAVVAPFRDPSVEATTAAVLGLMILGSGLSEARDTLVPGLASFLVFTLRTLAARQAEDAAVPVARPSRGRPRVGAPALVPQEQAQG